MASLALSLAALILIFFYLITKKLAFYWDSKKAEKYQKRINDFLHKENELNRSIKFFSIPISSCIKLLITNNLRSPQAFQTGLPFYNAHSQNNSMLSFNWLQPDQPYAMSTPNPEQHYPPGTIFHDEFFNLSSTEYKNMKPTPKKLEYLDDYEKKYFEDLFKKYEPITKELKSYKLASATAIIKKSQLSIEDSQKLPKKNPADARGLIQAANLGEKKIEDTEVKKEISSIDEQEQAEGKNVRFRVSLQMSHNGERKKEETVDQLENARTSIEPDSLETEDEVSSETSLASTLGVKSEEFNLGNLNEEPQSMSDFSDSLNSDIYTTISSETSVNLPENYQATIQGFQKIIIREKTKTKKA